MRGDAGSDGVLAAYEVPRLDLLPDGGAYELQESDDESEDRHAPGRAFRACSSGR